jgi:MoxR-like ATPase
MTVEGPAAEASRKGEILFLDEMDGFPSNSLLPLNTILNGDRRIYAPVIGEIEVHSGLRIIGAANTNGRSKDRTYTGRNRLDGAFLNRFAVVVRTEYEERIDRKVVLETLASLKKPEEKKKPKPEEKKKPKPEEKPTKKAKVTVKKTAKKAGR